ncbi:ZZ-type domain-containing protein [Caenorhabditis elegans]|uniref:ZZ-type domain-containing protein n=1 Tax=Caenorhabditis elegans TaxID=6239 RepID=O18138_CAEEL|nr:ZZ-type domain-containing protein [Caenorhabditis elegans]CAB04847.1 ZZ-type domain-containing protein [Caenorhabditis elegans]|eukprot:NP_507738.1 SeQueSTosome related [Caenorhabditis elegans]
MEAREPSSLAEELELVPPELRSNFENKSSSIIPLYLSSNTSHSASSYTRTVYVTFHKTFEKKVVSMDFSESTAFEDISRRARSLFPGSDWRIFSGNPYHSNVEIHSSSEIYSYIKRTTICGFEYLVINLEPIVEPHHTNSEFYAKCDSCGTQIAGRRYKCTMCADFDICERCEAKSVHLQHAMLRISTGLRTEIPGYITMNAPSYVFGETRPHLREEVTIRHLEGETLQ